MRLVMSSVSLGAAVASWLAHWPDCQVVEYPLRTVEQHYTSSQLEDWYDDNHITHQVLMGLKVCD